VEKWRVCSFLDVDVQVINTSVTHPRMSLIEHPYVLYYITLEYIPFHYVILYYKVKMR